MPDYQADKDSGTVNIKGRACWEELTVEQAHDFAEKLRKAAEYADPDHERSV